MVDGEIAEVAGKVRQVEAEVYPTGGQGILAEAYLGGVLGTLAGAYLIGVLGLEPE